MKKKKSKLTNKNDFKDQLNYLQNKFLKYLKHNNYSFNTIDSYKYRINKFNLFLKQNTNLKSIKELSTINILDFKDFLKKQNVNPQNAMVYIKTFCTFLLKQNILLHNPFNAFTNYKFNSKIRKPESLWELTEADNNIKKYLAKLKNEFTQHLKSEGLANRTIEGYDGQLNYFFYFLLTKTKLNSLEELDKEILRNYQTYLSTKLLSLTTQTRRLIPVKKLCHYLFEQEQHDRDISTTTKLPKRKKPLPKGILKLSQIAKILSQPDITTPLGLRDRTILEVLYATGIRNQELRKIKLSDIDTARLEILIDRGKGGKSRIVPTGELGASFIEDYIQKARPYLTRLNPDINYLFLSRRSKILTATDLGKIVEKYCKKAGIKEHITPHSFRHTCATHMLKNKASLRHIQVLLGHSSIKSTQIYTKVEISDLQKVHQRCHPRGRKQSTP